MYERVPEPIFHSELALYLHQFLEEKRVLGCCAASHAQPVSTFDRFLVSHGVTSPDLEKSLIEAWTQKRPHESPTTHARRVSLARQIGLFLVRRGFHPYVPDPRLSPKGRSAFTPYIFTPEQIKHLLAAADQIRPDLRSPHRERIFPLIFRLLYSCGLRVSEPLHLQVRDVDVAEGILTIRQSKFNKDRLVPVVPSLTARLQDYAHTCLRGAAPTTLFFPAPDGGPFCHRVIYDTFRRILWQCGISYQGRSRGPRLHDLRHTFAVHRFMQWDREGMDLDVALPILAAYLGHVSLSGTQRYLHLTAQMYPELRAKLDAHYGWLIPREEQL